MYEHFFLKCFATSLVLRKKNHIGDVMVRVVTLRVVDRGFEFLSGQTIDRNWYLLLLR